MNDRTALTAPSALKGAEEQTAKADVTLCPEAGGTQEQIERAFYLEGCE